MKLHAAPRTRAVRPRWILEELEVPYELVKTDGPNPLHPLGEVPVLVDGDVTLFESPAMCLYLADRFPEKKLAPAIDSPDRGPYLQWLLFAETHLESLVLDVYRGAQVDHARLKLVLDVIEARVRARSFVVGDAFTAADVVLASILHLANTLKLLEDRPGLLPYLRRQVERPAIRRAVTY
ncbi:MAG: glutathione S-transferase family protein [Archangiaceae bacterium]|nr:glutathione S-transferase family protein [Archangiaceae bacterium]